VWRWVNTGSAPGYEPVRRLAAHLIAEHPQVADDAAALLPAAGYQTPPVSTEPFPAIADPEPVPVAAEDAEAVASAGIIALLRPHERRVWEQVRAHPEGTPAEVIFTDPMERALWRRTLASEHQRVREIAAWRSVQLRPTARRAG